MAKIIDRRNKSMGGGDKRSIRNIQNIAIHYSATAQGNTASFERFWKNTNGWNTGGYHEVVLLNGDVELNYNADTISNGVGGQNTRMYNICYVGAGVPNAAQLKTLKERANYNRNRFGLSANAVRGHREYSGQSTSCPGLNMGDFRKSLDGASTVKPSKPKVKPAKTTSGNLGLVDWMKSKKMDSSFNNRKKLASKHGISNYKGTAAQNNSLLAKLRSGKPSNSTQNTSKKGNQTTNSIVTYLNSINVDSSYANRSKLAKQHGISNYKGTASQNTTLLSKLRSGSSS